MTSFFHLGNSLLEPHNREARQSWLCIKGATSGEEVSSVVLLPLRHDPRQGKVTMLAGMRLEGDDMGVV